MEAIEGEEEVTDAPSSRSSDSQDLAIVGIGARPVERGSEPNKPPATGSDEASFLSDHWFDLLPGILGAVSESSSGVAGAGESVEDEEDE